MLFKTIIFTSINFRKNINFYCVFEINTKNADLSSKKVYDLPRSDGQANTF